MKWDEYKTLKPEAKEEYEHRFRAWKNEGLSFFPKFWVMTVSIIMLFGSVALYLAASEISGFSYMSYVHIITFCRQALHLSVWLLILDIIISVSRDCYYIYQYNKFRKANKLKLLLFDSLQNRQKVNKRA
jgi:hypothetical protein